VKAQAGWRTQRVHCVRVPGFPRGFKVRIVRRFFGAWPREKSYFVSVHVCVRVSRAIMPADVYDFISFFFVAKRCYGAVFRRTRCARNLCAQNRAVGQVFYSGDRNVVYTYFFLTFVYFMDLFYLRLFYPFVTVYLYVYI